MIGQSCLSSVALTDDEIVAVAVRRRVDWRSPLPSLAGCDESAMVLAGARGWRSLDVRDLIEDDDLGPGLAELLQAAMRPRVVVRTFPTASSGEVPLLGTFLTAYEISDDEVLVEVTSGTGVHAFERHAVGALRELVGEALNSVVARGIEVPTQWPADVPPPDSLWAVSNVSGRALGVVATRGHARLTLLDGARPADLDDDCDVVAALCQVLSPERVPVGTRV